MANYCSNRVVFEGSEKAIAQIQEIFQNMKDRQEATDKGQLPEFINREDGYFMDIYWHEGDKGIFQYETRWAPNTEVLQSIAYHYNSGFTLDYEEMENFLYGRITYRGGVLSDTALDDEDFDTYQLNFQTGVYHFEGQTYQDDCEILETLLERRIANSQHKM